MQREAALRVAVSAALDSKQIEGCRQCSSAQAEPSLVAKKKEPWC